MQVYPFAYISSTTYPGVVNNITSDKVKFANHALPRHVLMDSRTPETAPIIREISEMRAGKDEV